MAALDCFGYTGYRDLSSSIDDVYCVFRNAEAFLRRLSTSAKGGRSMACAIRNTGNMEERTKLRIEATRTRQGLSGPRVVMSIPVVVLAERHFFFFLKIDSLTSREATFESLPQLPQFDLKSTSSSPQQLRLYERYLETLWLCRHQALRQQWACHGLHRR